MLYKKIAILIIGSTIFCAHAMEDEKKPAEINNNIPDLLAGMQKDLQEISAAVNEMQALHQQMAEKEKAKIKFDAESSAYKQQLMMNVLTYIEKIPTTKAEQNAYMEKLKKDHEDYNKSVQEAKAIIQKPLGKQ